MGLTIVRELGRTGFGSNAIRIGDPVACLVTDGVAFWVVSSAHTLDHGPETLVFPATADGEVCSWIEAAGGPGYSREEAIQDLQNGLSGPDVSP